MTALSCSSSLCQRTKSITAVEYWMKRKTRSRHWARFSFTSEVRKSELVFVNGDQGTWLFKYLLHLSLPDALNPGWQRASGRDRYYWVNVQPELYNQLQQLGFQAGRFLKPLWHKYERVSLEWTEQHHNRFMWSKHFVVQPNLADCVLLWQHQQLVRSDDIDNLSCG